MKPPPPRDGTGEDSFVGQLRSRLWDGEALGVEGGRSFAVPPGDLMINPWKNSSGEYVMLEDRW